jgi:transposase-like protein
VGKGVPLTIGWNHEKELAYGLEDYENDHRSKPKPLADMKFSQEERAEIAKNLGYSESKIERIARKVKSSTLTRKKKVVKALHLVAIKDNVNKGVTKISEVTKRLRGVEEEEEEEDDRDEMAF